MRYTFKTYQHKDGNRRYRYYKIIYGKSGGLEEKAKKKALRNVNIIFCVCAPCVCATELLNGIKLGKNPFTNLQVVADKKSEQLSRLLRSDGRLEFESQQLWTWQKERDHCRSWAQRRGWDKDTCRVESITLKRQIERWLKLEKMKGV